MDNVANFPSCLRVNFVGREYSVMREVTLVNPRRPARIRQLDPRPIIAPVSVRLIRLGGADVELDL